MIHWIHLIIIFICPGLTERQGRGVEGGQCLPGGEVSDGDPFQVGGEPLHVPPGPRQDVHLTLAPEHSQADLLDVLQEQGI